MGGEGGATLASVRSDEGSNLDDCKTIVQNKPDADSSLGNNGGNAF